MPIVQFTNLFVHVKIASYCDKSNNTKYILMKCNACVLSAIIGEYILKAPAL